MKGQLKASTPEEYIEQLTEPRKSEIAALDAMMRKAAPKARRFIQDGILAYGARILKYADGREVNWYQIGIASNENYISLYVGREGQKFKEALPKANIGKGCVRFKKLSDQDPAALKQLIRDSLKARA